MKIIGKFFQLAMFDRVPFLQKNRSSEQKSLLLIGCPVDSAKPEAIKAHVLSPSVAATIERPLDSWSPGTGLLQTK